MYKDNNNKNKAFTLIELLVVISIIGLLSTVVLASLNTARGKARDARRMSDMKQVQLALELYRDKNGAYPPAAAGDPRENSCGSGSGLGVTGVLQTRWSTALTSLVTDSFLPNLPNDPKPSTFNDSTIPDYCYGYLSAIDTSAYRACVNQDNTVVTLSNVEYILYLSLENPPTNRYRPYWAADFIASPSASPPMNTCILGPRK